MNLEKFNCDMACFSLFVDVVYNKHKHVKASLGHPQIKSGSNYGCFSKGSKQILFHGLANHHWITSFNELSFVRKHNSTTLMKDKPF